MEKLQDQHRDGLKQTDVGEHERLQARMRMLRYGITMHTYAFEYLTGCICHEEGRHEQALEHLLKAGNADNMQVFLFLKLWEVHLRIGHDTEARQAFEQILELDLDNA